MSMDDGRSGMMSVSSRHDLRTSDDENRPHEEGISTQSHFQSTRGITEMSWVMELFFLRIHHIVWGRGDGNGRIRMSYLKSTKWLSKTGEPLVLPPETRGDGLKRMIQVLQMHPNEQLVVEMDENNDMWVRSLKNATTSVVSKEVESRLLNLSSHTFTSLTRNDDVLKKYIESLIIVIMDDRSRLKTPLAKLYNEFGRWSPLGMLNQNDMEKIIERHAVGLLKITSSKKRNKFVHVIPRSFCPTFDNKSGETTVNDHAVSSHSTRARGDTSGNSICANATLNPKMQPSAQKIARQRTLNAGTTREEERTTRSICFDKANGYRLASSELMKATRPADGFFGEPLRVLNEVDEVLNILPQHIKAKLAPQEPSTDEEMLNLNPNGVDGLGFIIDRQPRSENIHEESNKRRKIVGIDTDMLSDIVLDVGRAPHCWVNDRRVLLSDRDDDIVTQKDVIAISGKLGQFGSDNRAGLNGTLHRFSRMLDRHGNIAGITARIGRHVYGNAAMLMDFLMSSNKSILILGEPGSGKTTIVRDATRKLAEQNNVIVVDTSNEIGGDGTMPHPCIGHARRMMVPSLDMQSSVMVECVQNHTPHVMVIDEIGRLKEVQAARTVKQRGVRMIASAHGSFRTLLKNKDLNGLIGGIESVTIGDEMAKEEAKRKNKPISKRKVQRCSEPTFEVIVEVQRGSRNEWRVISDSARAVDQILDGLNYKAQLRIRDPVTGTMRLAIVDG